MTTSEQVNEIAAALAKAQSSMKNAALNKVNPHFKSKFADLASVRDAVVPALASQGISVSQTMVPFEGRVCLATRLLHSSGQWLESLMPIPEATDMQKLGSALTYARRYSLSAICGIAADEDDDANEASKPQRTPVAIASPPGYDDWFDDLTTTADNGTAALEATWKKSQPHLRKYLLDTNGAAWEALKTKAAKVKAPEAVRA